MTTSEDRVILILGEYRIEAIKHHLISQSTYFTSLFSSNFRDSRSNEHRINYDVDINTLRTFVMWTTEGPITSNGNNYYIKSSLQRYMKNVDEFEDMLKLLQLSVIFAAETLIMDLTDLIACHWLTSEKSVQLWMLAKELNLPTLQNLAKAACIEHLSKIPESSLLELSGEDFISLLGNVHVQANSEFLLSLMNQWKLNNVLYEESNTFEIRYPFTLLAEYLSQPKYKVKFEEQRLKNHIQCVVGHKLNKDNTGQASYVYCWDGITFVELVEIRNPLTTSPVNIVGMQAVGRGFDIYLVGGEYGLGTGRFEKEIWRYSTISKIWYYVTSLPEPRRHMAVAFLNEKLFVIGGVGRHRLKLSTVDVYDIYKGEWSKVADVPEEFTNIPPLFKFNENLAIYKSALYTYHSKNNCWITSIGQFCSTVSNEGIVRAEPISVQFLMFNDGRLYIIDSSHKSRAQIWTVENVLDRAAIRLGSCVTMFHHQVANGPYLIGFSNKDGKIFVEIVKLGGSKACETILVHSEMKNDVHFGSSFGCFNIFNSKTLDEQFDLFDV